MRIALFIGVAGRLRLLPLPLPWQGSLGVDDPQLPVHAADRRGDPDPADGASGRADDTKPGLIIPYVAFSLPLVIWIMIGFFDEVPRDIDAAAALDGCGAWGTLDQRAPAARRCPGILVAAIFSGIFIWNEFLVGLYLINSEDQKTIPIAAAGLISAQRPIDWDVAATVGVVTMVPLLIASIFIQKYIVRGITAGAVK